MAEKSTTSKAQPLRSLLPAHAEGLLMKAPAPKESRKKLVTAACSACRKQKAKCSGERPACRRCARQRIQCHYTTRPGETESQAANRKRKALQARAADLEELFELLKNLPEQDAQGVLQRLRSENDVETILRHVKVGDLLCQMAVVPETRFRYEFPYGLQMPEDFVPNNPYLDSMIYEGASLYSTNRCPSESRKCTANLGSKEHQTIYLRPFHAAQIIDPQLASVKISSWTTVCDDDVLMRDLLGGFLRCEYHFTAAFQKDLFLEDMAAQREEFCSSLLVNIVLGYSCVCNPRFSNRAEYWNPHTLLYRFIAEAKRLWELEATKPRITTIQAGILFNVFHNLCGLDEIGQAYRIQAIALAHQLRLFDSNTEGCNERVRKGRAFAAWALYNWETLVAFSFVFSPLLQKPPDWQLPDPMEEAQWYGEIWIQYPSSQKFYPSYFGHVFRARSNFRIIMNEFCQAAYSKGSKLACDQANKFLSQLKGWYYGLPSPLLPKTIVLPGHLQLHMYYHHLILTIYEPLLNEETDHESAPRHVVADAKKHLQTLVRLYYLRHGFEAMDLFIVIPLMLAGCECIDAINERTPLPKLEVLRSTLILVAKGLYDQRRNHYLAEALYRVIRGRMRPSEVALLRGTMDLKEDEPTEKREMVQSIRSHWPVSVVRRMEDMDSQILTNLVENYAHVNIQDPKEKLMAL